MNAKPHIYQYDLSKRSYNGKTLNLSNDEHKVPTRYNESNIYSLFNYLRPLKYQTPTQFVSQYELPTPEDPESSQYKFSDNSLKVISIQIRRLRGICSYLSKNIDCPVVYEIFGRCVSKGNAFTNIPGISFVLQENDNKQTVQTINCALYDFDEILPDIRVGNIYRCAGRYHCQKYIFQCFNIEELNEDEVHLMESIQYQSNLELTELTKPRNFTQKVSRVIWRPNSIANSSTITFPTEYRHFTAAINKKI
ncbi:hypothetical protein MS3_00010612 [Schistosoma haematobium]|uniref:Spermatogenesis-associated protein 22 n=1 Tax=Schistosoma haematobium TaxID=6185 RepID=A0A095A215_SCHHA|nr:hypothetical protein MS3_00010612 [Schistosoma haematobium]KAH9587662.1 hypothetical protein MS3_00010612 [Schistosoma haematobium]CAH8554919.1 unnamed protein product [Schistosoma haematobium]